MPLCILHCRPILEPWKKLPGCPGFVPGDIPGPWSDTFPHFALCAACAPIPCPTAGNTSLPWVDSPGCALSSSLESPGGCREGSELSLTPSLPTVLPLPRFSRSVWLPEFPKLFPSPAFLGKKPQKLRDPGAPQRQENVAHVPGVPS